MSLPYITYNGRSKVIQRLCELTSALFEQESGLRVTVSPLLDDGIPIANITIGEDTITLYVPGKVAPEVPYSFSIVNGHLILRYTGEQPAYSLQDGHLVYSYTGEAPDLSIAYKRLFLTY